ncbi:hypothetical protein BLOT_006426 [Blomia tropicalis]|nr:hypothetical protein BLOT_006426 [Blomia tropicalis]
MDWKGFGKKGIKKQTEINCTTNDKQMKYNSLNGKGQPLMGANKKRISRRHVPLDLCFLYT